MRRERQTGFACSVTLHVVLFILLIAGLPSVFEPPHIPEPEALTVEILPITGITNVKPSESKPAEKKKEEKKPEAKKPSPPVKTAESETAPPEEQKPKPEKKKEEKKKVEEKKPKEKKKMSEQDLLAVLKAVKQQADKEAKKNTEATSTSKSTSQQYNPELPLSLSEKDAIKGQISKCWNVPAGAKDAQNLIIILRAQYEKDGSLINVTLADKVKSRYGVDSFFRAATDSAIRAVRMCTPLHNLPPDKYETWRDMELTFDPKEMLF